MADKLEKLKGMAELAALFGGTPESEMRNRLLEQQIQAGREQTQALRHQTQGSMFRSLIDLNKFQNDQKLNALRGDALQSEIDANNAKTQAQLQTKAHAAALHEDYKRGLELENLGKETANTNAIAAGQQAQAESTARIKKLNQESTILQNSLDEYKLNARVRDTGRDKAIAENVAGARGADARLIADYISKLGNLESLPTVMREVIATGLKSMDPSGLGQGEFDSARSAPPQDTRTPKEITTQQVADTQTGLAIRELIESLRANKVLSEDEKRLRFQQLQDQVLLLQKSLNNTPLGAMQQTRQPQNTKQQ
tara:strand:- start:30 stop:962 length:933 start_codon:yes stop_codon:yes gene_type:complete